MVEHFNFKSSWEAESRLQCLKEDEPFFSTQGNSETRSNRDEDDGSPFPLKKKRKVPVVTRVKKRKRRLEKRSYGGLCNFV